MFLLLFSGLEPAFASPAQDAYDKGEACSPFDIDKKIQFYTQAVELDPDFAPAHIKLASELRFFDATKSLALLERAIRLKPRSAEAFYERGLLQADKEDFQAAVADFSKSIQFKSTDSAVFQERAEAYRHLCEFQKAVSDYDKAYYQLGGTFYLSPFHDNPERTEKVRALIRKIDALITKLPNPSPAYVCRARCFLEINECDNALRDLQKATNDSETRFISLIFSSDANYQKKDYFAAVQNYTDIIALDQKHKIDWMFRKAGRYEDLKDFQNALNVYSEMEKIDPANGQIYASRADTYEKMGILDKALAERTKAIELDPTATSFENRGKLYRKLNQNKNAIDDYTCALSKRPLFVFSTYTDRAEVYAAENQMKNAIADYSSALANLRHPDAEILKARGLCYVRAYEFKDAFNDFKSAFETDPNYEKWMYASRWAVVIFLVAFVIAVVITCIKKKILAETVSVIMLILAATSELEGDYYTILRFIICPLAAFTAFRFFKIGSIGWVWTFGVIAALFNPLIKVQLERETWQPIDIVTACLVAVSIFILKKKQTIFSSQNKPHATAVPENMQSSSEDVVVV